ncbi:MAG: PTS system mannose/fructose/sorbose family transporter subunit IID [Gemmatimonadota bacterium]
MRARRGVEWAVLLRSLAVQGSFNYETLTGSGFGFAILPALRRIHGGDREALAAAVQRHAGAFNSHPYLAPLALGAVIRLEEEGEDPEVIDRFKAALRGSLGTMGDRLVWTGWRPACVLGMLALLLMGLPWWFAILAFLVLYNVGHFGLMVWGLSVGLAEGRGVAHRLTGSVRTTLSRVMAGGALLAGAVIALVVVRGVPGAVEPSGWLWLVLAAAGAAAGARWGERVRRVAVAGAVLLGVVGLLAGLA